MYPAADKKWIFKLDGSTHQVELKQQYLKSTSITVDGEVLDWKQSPLELLDFGGTFCFTLRSGHGIHSTNHDCQVTVNMWHTYLLVDGVDVESGRRYPYSAFRLGVRVVMLAIVLLAVWASMPSQGPV